MNNSLVSIIVPIYNVEKYLERCLESVKRQSYQNIEIIMVNDGSTDNSQMIAKKYEEQDKRFVLLNKKNGGLSSARNYGLEFVHGDFVSFIDSDDFIHCDYVKELIKKIDEDMDIVIGDYSIYNEKDNQFYNHKNPLINQMFTNASEKEELVKYLFDDRYSVMPVWKNLYRVDFLKENQLIFASEREVYAEDLLFNVEAYMKARKVKMIDNVLIFHQIVPGSLSQSYRENYFEMYKELDLRITQLLELNFNKNILEWYEEKRPERIGSALFNMCKCNFKESIENVKKILSDKMSCDTYNNSKIVKGKFRYLILYRIGKFKMPILVVICVKLMLVSEPVYRVLQRKKVV